MNEIFKRANQYLLFVILLIVVLYFGKSLLIPIVFAALLAMLMAPVCRRLDRWGFHRAISSLACVLILAGAVAGAGFIVKAQFTAFAKDVTKIQTKAKDLLHETQAFIEKELGVSPEEQKAAVKQQAQKSGKSAGAIGTKLLGSLATAVAGMVVTLVFTFLLIYSKEKYEDFFLKLFARQDPDKVKKIVAEISHVSQQYLTGRVMSIIIIAVLYSIGLSIVGIKNAIILACIAALLTVVPYIGTVMGGLFPVFMALVTEDSLQPALLAVLVMFAIQTMDNYFIEPNVVGGEVNLSALTSIISIIAGGMVWGIAGMILFLPMAGILKIVSDHVENLKPIGYVIGDPAGKKSSKITEWIKKQVGSLKKNRKGA